MKNNQHKLIEKKQETNQMNNMNKISNYNEMKK